MLIYEKDNKLNISFENNMEDTDIQIGKDEVKIGESTISENNVLSEATSEDAGKVPVVQEDGSYTLETAGGGSAPFVVTLTSSKSGEATSDKTPQEIVSAAQTGIVIGKRANQVGENTVINTLFNLSRYDIDGDTIRIFFTCAGATEVATVVIKYDGEEWSSTTLYPQ